MVPHCNTVACHNSANDFSAELVLPPRSVLKEAINSAETLITFIILILCYATPKKKQVTPKHR